MSAKFQIFQDSKKHYRFRLRAGNGEIVCQSQGYRTKAGARKGLVAVLRASVDRPPEDLTLKPKPAKKAARRRRKR